MTGAMRAVALIPAFNEAATIQEVVDGLQGAVSRVVVVDDGSTDATPSLAARAGADVIRRTGARGKGRAIRAGLAALAGQPFTHVLTLDGDMQHLPAEAPLLLEAAARTGADVVLGARRFDRHAMPASRYHANRIGSRALSSFVGIDLPDTQCGFRVFRTAALEGLRVHSRGYDIETEMLVKLSRRGARIVSIPVTAVYGRRESRLRPVRDTTRTCFLAVYYRYLERL